MRPGGYPSAPVVPNPGHVLQREIHVLHEELRAAARVAIGGPPPIGPDVLQHADDDDGHRDDARCSAAPRGGAFPQASEIVGSAPTAMWSSPRMARLLLLLLLEAAAVAAVLLPMTSGAASAALPLDVLADGAAWAGEPGPVLVALARTAAALGATWLLVVTLVDVGRAAAGRAPGTSPGWVQRVVAQAVGASLLLSVATPAIAAPAPAPGDPPAAAVVLPPVPLVGVPAAPADARPPVDATAPPAQEQMPMTDPITGAVASDEVVHVVVPGDSLWDLAAARAGAAADDRDVHAYWVRVIEANEVPSGDPDLIHPGDRIVLPPLAAPGAGAPT